MEGGAKEKILGDMVAGGVKEHTKEAMLGHASSSSSSSSTTTTTDYTPPPLPATAKQVQLITDDPIELGCGLTDFKRGVFFKKVLLLCYKEFNGGQEYKGTSDANQMPLQWLSDHLGIKIKFIKGKWIGAVSSQNFYDTFVFSPEFRTNPNLDHKVVDRLLPRQISDACSDYCNGVGASDKKPPILEQACAKLISVMVSHIYYATEYQHESIRLGMLQHVENFAGQLSVDLRFEKVNEEGDSQFAKSYLAKCKAFIVNTKQLVQESKKPKLEYLPFLGQYLDNVLSIVGNFPLCILRLIQTNTVPNGLNDQLSHIFELYLKVLKSKSVEKNPARLSVGYLRLIKDVLKDANASLEEKNIKIVTRGNLRQLVEQGHLTLTQAGFYWDFVLNVQHGNILELPEVQAAQWPMSPDQFMRGLIYYPPMLTVDMREEKNSALGSFTQDEQGLALLRLSVVMPSKILDSDAKSHLDPADYLRLMQWVIRPGLIDFSAENDPLLRSWRPGIFEKMPTEGVSHSLAESRQQYFQSITLLITIFTELSAYSWLVKTLIRMGERSGSLYAARVFRGALKQLTERTKHLLKIVREKLDSFQNALSHQNLLGQSSIQGVQKWRESRENMRIQRSYTELESGVAGLMLCCGELDAKISDRLVGEGLKGWEEDDAQLKIFAEVMCKELPGMEARFESVAKYNEALRSFIAGYFNLNVGDSTVETLPQLQLRSSSQSTSSLLTSGFSEQDGTANDRKIPEDNLGLGTRQGPLPPSPTKRPASPSPSPAGSPSKHRAKTVTFIDTDEMPQDWGLFFSDGPVKPTQADSGNGQALISQGVGALAPDPNAGFGGLQVGKLQASLSTTKSPQTPTRGGSVVSLIAGSPQKTPAQTQEFQGSRPQFPSSDVKRRLMYGSAGMSTSTTSAPAKMTQMVLGNDLFHALSGKWDAKSEMYEYSAETLQSNIAKVKADIKRTDSSDPIIQTAVSGAILAQVRCGRAMGERSEKLIRAYQAHLILKSDAWKTFKALLAKHPDILLTVVTENLRLAKREEKTSTPASRLSFYHQFYYALQKGDALYLKLKSKPELFEAFLAYHQEQAKDFDLSELSSPAIREEYATYVTTDGTLLCDESLGVMALSLDMHLTYDNRTGRVQEFNTHAESGKKIAYAGNGVFRPPSKKEEKYSTAPSATLFSSAQDNPPLPELTKIREEMLNKAALAQKPNLSPDEVDKVPYGYPQLCEVLRNTHFADQEGTGLSESEKLVLTRTLCLQGRLQSAYYMQAEREYYARCLIENIMKSLNNLWRGAPMVPGQKAVVRDRLRLIMLDHIADNADDMAVKRNILEILRDHFGLNVVFSENEARFEDEKRCYQYRGQVGPGVGRVSEKAAKYIVESLNKLFRVDSFICKEIPKLGTVQDVTAELSYIALMEKRIKTVNQPVPVEQHIQQAQDFSSSSLVMTAVPVGKR